MFSGTTFDYPAEASQLAKNQKKINKDFEWPPYHDREFKLCRPVVRNRRLWKVHQFFVSDYQLYQPSCYNCRKVGLFVVYIGFSSSISNVSMHKDNSYLVAIYPLNLVDEASDCRNDSRLLSILKSVSALAPCSLSRL
jgi:hypothetical protein